MTTATAGRLSTSLVRLKWWPRWLRPVDLLGAIGVGMSSIGLVGANVDRVDGLGLLRAPAPAYYVGLALVVASAVLNLEERKGRAGWFLAHLVALAILLHGLPGIIESNPRFPTAYLHVGFTDQIATNGRLLPRLDARFSWPGFFAGAALLQQAAGGSLLLWTLKFFPVLINLLACLMIVMIGRAAGVGRLQCRIACLLFVSLNWVAQDYFAPQAVGFLLYLSLVATALLAFGGSGPRRHSRRERWFRPRAVRPASLSVHWQRPALVGMAFVTTAIVTSHQITPGFLSISLLVLALLGVIRLRAFPVAIVVTTVSWFAFSAEAYWRGHLRTVTGSAGKVGELVQQNVTSRADSGSTARSLVVVSRLGLAGLVAVAVLISLLLLWRRRSVPLALAALVGAPVPMLLLQAYGGEMLLRVFLFALPAACLLVAELIVPADSVLTSGARAALVLVLLAVIPVFVVARFGNESYERISDDDLVVVNTLYRVAPPHSVVLLADTKSPTPLERVDEVRFNVLNSAVPDDIIAELKDAIGYRGRFVMLTEGQDQSGVQLEGKSPGWTMALAQDLLSTGSFSKVENRGGAILLEFRPMQAVVAEDHYPRILAVNAGRLPRVEVEVVVPPLLAAQTLPIGSFQVNENGRPSPVMSAVRLPPADLRVVLVLDTAVAPAILIAEQGAAREFVFQLPPQVQVGIVATDPEPNVVASPGTDRSDTIRSIVGLRPTAPSSADDVTSTLGLALSQLLPRRGTGVVVTVDSRPVATAVPAALSQDVTKANATVYPIVLNDPPLGYLGGLAARSGGRVLQVDDPGRLLSAYDIVVNELLGRYRIAFATSATGSHPADLTVTARGVRGTTAFVVDPAVAPSPSASRSTQ